jgi:pimeloyl-ACP methyl ester carboxylesterase
LIDVLHVRSLGRPAHLVGHSKGGGVATDVALRVPEHVRQLVNIDGFGPPPEGFVIPAIPQDGRPLPARFADFLDDRCANGDSEQRVYASLEKLVERRSAQNPRLSRDWLRYF